MSWAEISAFEIDFLPVANGERSGDAIAIRWQQPDGFYIAVVDGGTKKSSEQPVEHICTEPRAGGSH